MGILLGCRDGRYSRDSRDSRHEVDEVDEVDGGYGYCTNCGIVVRLDVSGDYPCHF